MSGLEKLFINFRLRQIPNTMQTEEFSWKTPDNLKIYGKTWKATEPKAVVCLVHGMFEHCNRYEHYAKGFTDAGFSVVGYDRRGHGQSEGQLGHTPSYEALLQEVDGLLENAKSQFPDKPVILYGHSQGGNIVLNHILSRKPKIDLAITTGAWIILNEEPSAGLVFVGKILNKILPTLNAPNSLNPDHISSLPEQVKDYVDDKLIHSKFTFRTGFEMLEAADRLKEYAGSFPVPLLMMHGSKDSVISPESSNGFSARVEGDIELKIWKDQYHEVHNDVKSKEMLNYALDWINRKL